MWTHLMQLVLPPSDEGARGHARSERARTNRLGRCNYSVRYMQQYRLSRLHKMHGGTRAMDRWGAKENTYPVAGIWTQISRACERLHV